MPDRPKIPAYPFSTAAEAVRGKGDVLILAWHEDDPKSMVVVWTGDSLSNYWYMNQANTVVFARETFTHWSPLPLPIPEVQS